MKFAKYQQHALVSAGMILWSVASAFSTPQLLPATAPSSQIGQMPAPPPPSSNQTPTGLLIPQDPKEMLLAAAQVNGLDAPGLKPWHIFVSFDKFDEDGDNVDSGTYEEYWAGPKQYRLNYTSQDFTQTDVATENSLFRTGADKWPGELQTRVRDEFVRPMFREMNLDYEKPKKTSRDFGNLKLPCVLLRRSDGGNMIVSDDGLPSFCFEPDTLMLRFNKGGMGSVTVWEQTVYRNIVKFQGRFVARDIEVTRAGKLFLKLHLETLQSIPQLNLADFTPPANAAQIDEHKITPDVRVLMLDYLLHQEMPKYPPSIHAPGGKAVMKYLITKEGRVTDVQFVEGNKEMQRALQDALKKFEYRPFMVRGEPVEVEVKQQFVYEMHGR